MSTKSILEGLNSAQREAVTHEKGPLLVLAGAGSGKTRVITHRFAHLSCKLSPERILTVTFTNKAAEEMKDRISKLTRKDLGKSWVGTFHSQCAKILRKEIKILGYGSDFSILDEEDQAGLVRHILKEFKLYEALYKGILSRISLLKSSFVSPEEFLSNGDSFDFEDKLARVYLRYQDELKRSNSLDFDDLILLTIRLFKEHPKVLEKYQDIFRHILIDEFQDTNPAQYKLVSVLVSSDRNICAVGDDDQSIYAFRGANYNNILNFSKDFKGTRIIKLEQNYRSTKTILNVAHEVISKNEKRHPKKLWTDRKDGEKVYLCWFNNETEESKHIAKTIREFYLKGLYKYKDFAVLYRVNLQSRAFEEALRDERIPYRVIGGMSFYQRKEVKDLIAYMRLCANNENNVSLRRVINCPPRGIGVSTLSKIEQLAKKKSISLLSALKETAKSPLVTQAIKGKLREFSKFVEDTCVERFKSASEMLRYIIEKTGYMEHLDEDRALNVSELISSAEGQGVSEFLDRVSLLSSQDEIEDANAVSLLTFHCAKGLEFPVVFISGVEDGILPYFKAKSSSEIAEERRLLYVGMTRAKDMLWLTCAKKRRLYTKIQEQVPSRFLKDIPLGCCELIEKTKIAPEQKIERHTAARPQTFKSPLYSVGCRVKHPTWGVGVVRDCQGEGDDQKITVNFPNVGVKKLALKFANIERI